MIQITKALVIDQPWIDLILSGVKTWEMRGTGTSFRGPFGLIRKGSGQVVGTACMIGSGSPLTTAQMIASIDKHHIPERMILGGQVAKWTTPWHLADARPLPRPVPYRHPYGAVTWVNLAPEVTAAIGAQLELRETQGTPAPIMTPVTALRPIPSRPQPAATPLVRQQTGSVGAAGGDLLGETLVTEANLQNNHFYMRAFVTRFPDALIAGKDRSPPVLATVEANAMPPTETDICPRHLFFRARRWTRQFLENHDAAPGDRVQVHQIAPLHYRISLVKG